MSNIYDLFAPESPAQEQQTFDKEAWAAKKKQEREGVFELADNTALEVAANSGRFQQYLDVQSRFDRYTATNALLVLAQKPEATRLQSLDKLKEQKQYIKKTEFKKPVLIIEPGDQYQREDGSVGTSYNVKRVYDVSQFEKRTVQPTVTHNERTLIKALMSNAPVTILAADNIPDGSGAVYAPDKKTIFIKKGMEAAEIFQCLSKELAIVELVRNGEEPGHDGTAFAAYCASYMICKKYNIDAAGYNFSAAPNLLEGMEAQDVKAELTVIRNVSAEINGRMAKVLEPDRTARDQEVRT